MNNLRAAVVLFAIFGCGGSVSYADDRPNSAPVQTLFLDSHDGITEWWICYSYGDGTQMCINTHRADRPISGR
jgi:hypothetical protein